MFRIPPVVGTIPPVASVVPREPRNGAQDIFAPFRQRYETYQDRVYSLGLFRGLNVDIWEVTREMLALRASSSR